MSFKNLAKKWGKIALCATVATAGVIGSATLGNSTQISAALTDRYYVMNFSATTPSTGVSSDYIQFEKATNNVVYDQDDFNFLMIGVSVVMNTTMSYDSTSKYYVDIDNIKDFDYSRDVVRVDDEIVIDTENSKTFISNFINLYSKTGNFSTYLTEGISNLDILNLVVEIAKNNVTLSDGTITLGLGSGSQSITLRSLKVYNGYDDNFSGGSNGAVLVLSEDFKVTAWMSATPNANNEKSIKLNIYNKSLDEMVNGYTAEDLANARQEGVDSVDPTLDNQQAIDDYIVNNNMKTETEYNAYGESQFTAGANSIDQTAIEQEGYNKGFTAGVESIDQEAIKEQGFKEGVSSVDPSVDNEEAIKNHIEKEELKTKEEYETHGKEQYDAGYKANSIWKKLGNFFTVSIPSFFKSGWNGFIGLFRKG